jgi:hypothetical protein
VHTRLSTVFRTVELRFNCRIARYEEYVYTDQQYDLVIISFHIVPLIFVQRHAAGNRSHTCETIDFDEIATAIQRQHHGDREA